MCAVPAPLASLWSAVFECCFIISVTQVNVDLFSILGQSVPNSMYPFSLCLAASFWLSFHGTDMKKTTRPSKTLRLSAVSCN